MSTYNSTSMSTFTPSDSEAPVAIDHPTHLAEPDRIIGRFTAPQLLYALCGVLGAVGVTQQHGVPPALRAGEALAIVLAGALVALWQPGGRGLLAWGRVLLTYRTSPRVFGWAPLAAPTGAGQRTDSMLPRPPHLPALRPVAAAVQVPNMPASAAPPPQPTCPSTQDRLYVPLAIDDDTVSFADGQRCATLELSGTGNAELLDAAGQRQLHTAYLGFLRGLTFPITLLHLITSVDLGAYAARREQDARRLPPRLRQLELANIDFMTRSVRRLGLVDQRTLLIIPTEARTTGPASGFLQRVRRIRCADAPEVEVEAEEERDRTDRLLAERCAAVVAALTPAGLHVRRLDTEALRALWHRQLRPRSAQMQPLRPEHGMMALGARVVFGALDRAGDTDGEDGGADAEATAILDALLAGGPDQANADADD